MASDPSHAVNRKRVQRLMQRMGLAAIYQRPRTSPPASTHRIYPYLLRGLRIERIHQVWPGSTGSKVALRPVILEGQAGKAVILRSSSLRSG